jgi:predicted RNA methylase
MGLFDGLQPSVVPPMSLGRRNPGHKIMLEDTARVGPYREALTRLVTPATRVLDLGCGTGLLGLLALQAGAKVLYAIEASQV